MRARDGAGPPKGGCKELVHVLEDLDDDLLKRFDYPSPPRQRSRPRTPQGKHHYTLSKQVSRLVAASESNPDMGFMTRMLTLCSLPRTNPGNRLQYVRHNGPYSLVIIAGGRNKLPFGSLPRLLLAWISTEAVRTRKRELTLGSSLSKFMRKLGIMDDSGSLRGDRTRLRNQMDRLFHAQVEMIYEDRYGKHSIASRIADRTRLWWSANQPDQPISSNSTIRLGEDLYQEIIAHPVPLDMNILRALKRSSLGLDLYTWLIYRTFALERPIRISWKQLYRQFGADLAKADDNLTVQNFRKECLRELVKIKVAWPDLNYATPRSWLEIRPSRPVIRPLTGGGGR